MSTENGRITLEQGLYGLALGIALLLRLFDLGLAPLGDQEASWALQALGIARGTPEMLGPQPGYVIPTGFLFFLFGSSTTLARLLPAIAGSLLVLAPYLVRNRLGRTAALVLAFGLAVDPGLVALSREAGAQMLAIALTGYGVVFWLNNRPALAGLCTGLGFLSGPAAIAGWVGLGLLIGGARALNWTWGDETAGRSAAIPGQGDRSRHQLRIGFLSAGVTILLIGTLYLRFPGGIGALAAAFPAYLGGWAGPADTPPLRLLSALLAYHLWPLIVGFVAIVRGWSARDQTNQWLSAWFLVALILAVLYPDRQVADLAWPLIPLWMLAAREFSRELAWDVEGGWTSLALAGLIGLFLAYIWLNFTSISRFSLEATAAGIRWRLIGGAVGLIVVSAVMIALGWSWNIARRGLIWGITVVLGVYTLGSAWGMVGGPDRRVREWWYTQPITYDEDLLRATLSDLSEWHTGRRDGIDVVVLGDVPSLVWSLRDYPNLRSEESLGPNSLPAVVIGPQQKEPQLAAAYRGTDFLWRVSPGWTGSFPEDALGWVISRRGPMITEYIILWARNDVFVDNSAGEFEG